MRDYRAIMDVSGRGSLSSHMEIYFSELVFSIL